MIDWGVIRINGLLIPFSSRKSMVTQYGQVIETYISYYIFGIRIAKLDTTGE